MALCFCSCGKTAVAPQEPELDLDGYIDDIELKDGFDPEIGIVLGSGLHPLADEVEVVQTIPYETIPDFPYSTVEGHAGEYILGYLEGVSVILMDGRLQYYEGYTMEQVVTPVRVMAKLGAETIILTNASGSMREDFEPGDLVCINDHIASFVPNPLIGQNDDDLRHMGVKILGISCVTNYCPNVIDSSTSHDEVEEISAKVSDKLIRLLKVTVKKMSATGQ